MTIWRCMKRLLLHSPAFTIAATLILALSIGANTTIFSIVNILMLRPLHYRDPGRLFAVQEVLPKLSNIYPTIPVSAYDFQQWRSHTEAFEGLALLDSMTVSLTSQEMPERVPLERVSANLFPLLGIHPALGRNFRPEEDEAGNDHVVIISDSLWRQQFHADPTIVGQTIKLDGIVYEIVGVAPHDLPVLKANDLRPAGRNDTPPQIWKPFGLTQDELHPFGDWNYSCIARLKPGVSIAQALGELNSVEAAMDASGPERSGLHAILVPLHDQITGQSRRGVALLFAAVFVVLLIGCANIANLVLVRANGQRRHWAIQSALGATTGTLARQALYEGFVLAILAGVGGLLVAYFSMKLLVASGIDVPRLQEIRMDWRVLAFSFFVTAGTGLFLGLLPMWQHSRGNLLEALKSTGQSILGGKDKKDRFLLVGLEVGMATVCLILAGLLLHSFTRLMHVDEGFDPQHIITFALSLPETQYSERSQRASLVEQVTERLKTLPGAEAVGIASLLPLTGEGDNNIITVEGTNIPKLERPVAEFRSVNPEFFGSLSVPVKRGRIFTVVDKGRSVAVISEQAAERLFPGRDPVGLRFHLGDESRPLLEVVGVVGDVRSISLEKDPYPMVYLPYWQRLGFDLFVAIRTPMDAAAMAPSIRKQIQQIDPELPVSEMRTMQQVVEQSEGQRKFRLELVLAFAIVAIILAGIGVYSVVAYAISRRTKELGLRLALGASPGMVMRLVLHESMAPIVAGMGFGVLVALVLGKLISSSLYGVVPYDPWTLAAVSVLILAVGVLACFFPAWRATEIDPLQALRVE